MDKGSEFYNRSTKSCLHDNDKEMYSTYNEEKFVVGEKFIRALIRALFIRALQMFDFNIKKCVLRK